MSTALSIIIPLFVIFFVILTIVRTVRIIPQARAGIVERLGRYQRTLNPGLHMVIPFVARLATVIDEREQVVSFPPQSVITEDNLMVNIDTVIYYQVTNPERATYEIADFLSAIEQLAVTTLRNVIGNLNLEQALTSRQSINTELRTVLDEVTGSWGVRVNRVELKSITPPANVLDSMEKQMKAEREKRAVILTAEGERQASILSAEGAKAAAILRAEGESQSSRVRAEGESAAIRTVINAIQESGPDAATVAYQYYTKTIPAIAEGNASKVWVVPSELTASLGRFGAMLDAAADKTSPPASED